MVVQINSNPVELSSDEVDNFFSDLADLSTQIDQTLQASDRRKANIEALLQRLNDLVDVYS